jgi:hypothetical protein
MSNKLTHSGHDESYSAVGATAADQAALKAFVRDAENGAYDDGDAENLAAAVEAIQMLLETPASAESTTEPTPAATKWADAADYSAATDDAATAVVSHPIDRIELPDAVDATAARTAYDAVLEFLVAAGPATDGEIAAGVMPAYSLGYTPPSATDSEAGIWWHKVIEPALDADATVSYDPLYGYALGGRHA